MPPVNIFPAVPTFANLPVGSTSPTPVNQEQPFDFRTQSAAAAASDAAAAGSEPAGKNNPDPRGDDLTESAQQAQEDANIAGEEMVVYANRSLPKLRGFTDQTFVLMHLLNLINLRNEKFQTALERLEKKEEDLGDFRDLLLTLKGENPYPYHSTPNNELERNAALQCYGEPYSFLNYLTAQPGYQGYIDIDNDKLSTLTSKIRLFKSFHSEGTEQIVEIAFDTDGISAADVENFIKNGSKRAYGVGIKNFDMSLDGVNPYTRERSVSATLVLHASSMDDLLKPRVGGTIKDPRSGKFTKLFYKYFDLAMKTDTTASEFSEPDGDGAFGALDDLDFKIIAQVGIVENSTAITVQNPYSSLTLNLGPITHSYDIAENGSITLTIDYKGHIEKEYTNPLTYDVFTTSESLKKDLYKTLGSFLLKDVCGADQASKFEQEVMAEGNSDLIKRSKTLTDILRNSGRIYYIDIPAEMFESYRKAFNTYEAAIGEADTDSDSEEAQNAKRNAVDKALNELKNALGFQRTEVRKNKTIEQNISNLNKSQQESKEVEKSMEDEEEDDKQNLNIAKCANDPNATQVAYFYAGDLINLILQQLSIVYSKNNLKTVIEEAMDLILNSKYMQETLGKSKPGSNSATVPPDTLRKINDLTNKYYARSERFSKFRAVLGPTMVKDFFTAQEIACSVGDIPIPLNHFNSWLANLVEGKKKYRIGLVDFLKEFVTTYMRSMLKGDSEVDQGVLGQLKLYDSIPLVGYTLPIEGVDGPPDKLNQLRLNFGGRKGLHYQSVPEDQRPLINTYKNFVDSNSLLEGYDYLVFFEKASTPVLDFDTAVSRAQFGIHTYQHGRDRGIFKNASFTRTNIKGLKEARFQAGKFNGLKQLTEVFDVTINSYADLAKFPGQRIYLDSKSLVPFLSAETIDSLNGYNIDDFGLGGFYVTQQVRHSFAPGKFETSIVAKWEAWPRDRRRRANPEKSSEVNEALVGIRNFEKRRAWERGPNTPDQEPTSPNCKNATDSNTGGSDKIYDAIIEKVEGFFGGDLGGMAESIIGYVKGLFDTKDGSEPSEFDIGAAFQADVAARRAGLDPDNPDRGSASTANNGPAGVE